MVGLPKPKPTGLPILPPGDFPKPLNPPKKLGFAEVVVDEVVDIPKGLEVPSMLVVDEDVGGPKMLAIGVVLEALSAGVIVDDGAPKAKGTEDEELPKVDNEKDEGALEDDGRANGFVFGAA